MSRIIPISRMLFTALPIIQVHPDKKLKGRDGYLIRVADHRIIYEIFDHVLLVDVIDLGLRKDIFN